MVPRNGVGAGDDSFEPGAMQDIGQAAWSVLASSSNTIKTACCRMIWSQTYNPAGCPG